MKKLLIIILFSFISTLLYQQAIGQSRNANRGTQQLTFKYKNFKGKIKTEKYLIREGKSNIDTAFISDNLILIEKGMVDDRGYIIYYGMFIKHTKDEYFQWLSHRKAKKNSKSFTGTKKFVKLASDFFSKNPSLSQKIKSKDKGYSPEDILKIVKEYDSFLNNN